MRGCNQVHRHGEPPGVRELHRSGNEPEATLEAARDPDSAPQEADGTAVGFREKGRLSFINDKL